MSKTFSVSNYLQTTLESQGVMLPDATAGIVDVTGNANAVVNQLYGVLNVSPIIGADHTFNTAPN